MPRGHRKLTNEQVRAVRDWYRQYRATPGPTEVAQRLGIHPTSLIQIARRKVYKELP